MARLRQKRSYNAIPRVSQRGRTGVARVSQIQGNSSLFTVYPKFCDTCDTLAIPLRRGGCRIYSSIIPMLIAQFWHLRYLFTFFYFLAQEKNFYPFRCRIYKCGINMATRRIMVRVVNTSHA